MYIARNLNNNRNSHHGGKPLQLHRRPTSSDSCRTAFNANLSYNHASSFDTCSIRHVVDALSFQYVLSKHDKDHNNLHSLVLSAGDTRVERVLECCVESLLAVVAR